MAFPGDRLLDEEDPDLSATQVRDLSSNDSRRVYSLDVMRGVTMALMLMVDVCGDTVPFFSHASWSGIHLADIVMPSFLFIVGASTAVSLPKFLPERRNVLISALLRASKLFVLGVLLQGAWIPAIDGTKDALGFDLEQVRIMGVLQRISICYFGLVLIVTTVSSDAKRCTFFLLLLVIQNLIIQYFPVPGCDYSERYSIECNAESFLDRKILGPSHLYRPVLGYDPEGLVSTLGCIFPCFLGFLSQQPFFKIPKFRISLASMLILAGLGFRCGWSEIPFNKALWSLSYNLLTSGTCIWVLTGLDALKITCVYKNPLAHLGMNAILFFVLSDCGGLLNVFLQSVWVSRDGRRVTLTSWFRDDVLSENIFIYALLQLFFFTCLTTLLYRRKMFFKIS